MDEEIVKYEHVIFKWCKYNIKESGHKIKNLDKDLHDGTKLCLIAKQITNDKNTEYHKNPKHHSEEKENFETAFKILNILLGYEATIEEDDFKKYEKAEHKEIVLTYFWQIMLKFKDLNFSNIYDEKINHHKHEDMPIYLQYLSDFETYISLKMIGSCWEIKHDHKPVFYHKDEKDEYNRFIFKSEDSYCLVGCAMVRGEKENSAIFVRLGKESKEDDRKAALKYADKLKKTLGNNNVIIVAEESNETCEYFDYVDPYTPYEEPTLDLHKVTNAEKFTLEKGIANDILINDELKLEENDIYVLSNPKEEIIFSSSTNHLKTRHTVENWRKHHENSKNISFTICHPHILPMRVYFTLVSIKEKEDEENLRKEEERLQREKEEEEKRKNEEEEERKRREEEERRRNEEEERRKKEEEERKKKQFEQIQTQSLEEENKYKILLQEKNHIADELQKTQTEFKKSQHAEKETKELLVSERNRFTEEEKKRKQAESDLKKHKEEDEKRNIENQKILVEYNKNKQELSDLKNKHEHECKKQIEYLTEEKNKIEINFNNFHINYKKVELERDTIKNQAQEALNKQKLEYDQYLLKLNTEIENQQKIILKLNDEKNQNNGELQKLLVERENTINSLKKNIEQLQDSIKKKESLIETLEKEISSLKENKQYNEMNINNDNSSSVGFSYYPQRSDNSRTYKIIISVLIILLIVLLSVFIYFIYKYRHQTN